MLVTVLCLLYCLAVIAVNGGDPLALVTIGTQFSEGIPEEAGGTEGYDGQFVYYIARDPSTAAPYIDVPAYRFQRILLPLAGGLLSFGQEALLPWVLLAVNLAALAGGTALLEHLLVQQGVSRWYALGYALSLGVFGTVRLSLPEVLAYGLVLGGIVLARREQWMWSALVFALAALAKETTLLFVAGYGLYLLIQQRWRLAVLFGLVAGLPFVVWQFVLYVRLGAFGVGSGGAMATGFEIIPLAGVLRILFEGGPVVFVIFLLLLGPFVLVPTYWALRESWLMLRAERLSAYVLLMAVNAAIMLFVPFSTYREPLGILRFIVGLQIAVILYAAEKPSRRALLNSTIWAITIFFLIGSDFAG
ncbi:MAG: hypothetical protein OHK0046_02760 [Anaerolineae bacterium]